MKSIDEGVETAEQFELLREIVCDEVQGFLLARPTDRDAAIQVLAQGARTST